MDGIRLPFTRRVNQFFGSESSPAPFFALFAFFAVDPKCRFWVQAKAGAQLEFESTADPFLEERAPLKSAIPLRLGVPPLIHRSSGGGNPTHARRRGDDQVIGKLRGLAAGKQRFQDPQPIFRAGGMNFDADHSEMCLQGQDGPVAKMTVQGDKRALVGDGLSENVRVVRPAQSNFTGPDNVMAQYAQWLGQFHPEHLIQKKSHEGSGWNEFGDLRADDAGFRKAQGCLDVSAGEFRVALEQCVPGFPIGKLAENDLPRYARALDDGAPATHARIQFDAIGHREQVSRRLPIVECRSLNTRTGVLRGSH